MKGSHKFWIAFWLVVTVVAGVLAHRSGLEKLIISYWRFVGTIFFCQQTWAAFNAWSRLVFPGRPYDPYTIPAKKWAQYTSIIYWLHTLLKRFNKLLDKHL